MDRSGTGPQFWPLKSSSGETPTLTQGKPTQFEFNDLPDRCPTGPLAYYLPGVLVTIKGTITQPAEGGSAISREELVTALFDSVDWTNSWFGAPVSKNFVMGVNLGIVEFVSNGFRYGQRQINNVPATTGAQPFSITTWIPAASDNRGRLIRDTSQLALLFQPSHLKLNIAATSTIIGALSSGATVGAMTASATAVLVPRQEIVLATPMEWVNHEIAVGGSSVKITGFGRDTALTGVEAKGGVAFLGELTQIFAQGGAVQPQNIESLTFQWRGQGELHDIDAWIDGLMGGLPNDRPQMSAGTSAGTADRSNDYQGFPYSEEALDTLSATIDANTMRFFPLVLGGNEMTLAELQTADTDETYYLNGTSVFSGGDNHEILAQYARQWQATKLAAFTALVKKGDSNSLAAYVLQDAYAGSQLFQRLPKAKHTLSDDQKTYLPWQLVSPAPAKKAA